jgi:hypothetical protein
MHPTAYATTCVGPTEAGGGGGALKNNGAFGITIHAAKYANMPHPTPQSTNATSASRTRIGSHPYRAASPAQTPAITLPCRARNNVGCGAAYACDTNC